jgi:MFS family permease
MHVPVAATIVLGLLLGLRHALDADHVAAVAALTEGREGLRRSLLTGVWWGAGHALALGAVGGPLLAARATLPPRLVLGFELTAALMLIVLGSAALYGALRVRIHVHEHSHDGVLHAHLHFHAVPHEGESGHHHPHPLRFALRPLLVGSVHGLAGSGAPALLILTTVPTALIGCLYLGVFGVGSILGMSFMSLVLAAPLAMARRRAAWLYRPLRAAAGIGSLALGASLVWGILSAAV